MKPHRTIPVNTPEMKKMMPLKTNHKNTSRNHACRFSALLFLVFICVLAWINIGGAITQISFSSAQDAVNDFIAAYKIDDDEKLLMIFGEEAQDLLSSGDAVRDENSRERFINAYEHKNDLVQEGEKMVLVIGENGWPFPIPLVQKDGRWAFDTPAGKDEILNRRIGENELNTIKTLLAIVDAQREYALEDHDGDGFLEYAQKFKSDPGEKNGLFWDTKEGEQPSPLGELVAQARMKGYGENSSTNEPKPYNGYFYEILTSQGQKAPGGAFDYIVNGHMIGGFAVIAYPAQYGNSGIMTFMVNHEGVVYQKDLGPETEKTAMEMKIYDLDGTWVKES